MGVFDRAEKRIGAAVDKVFARAFKGDVQPVEIAAGIQRELDSEAKLLSRDKRLVPNVFTVSLSPHDYNRLFPYTKTLNSEIIPELRAHAAERSYVFNGSIQILYMLEQSLPTGQFRVTSQAVATAPDQAPTPRPRASQQLVLSGNVQGAISVLEHVHNRLSRFDQPELLAIKQAVSSDLASLKNHPYVDISGTALRIDRLETAVAGLPLLIDGTLKPSTNENSRSPNPNLSWWENAWEKSLDALKGLVEVRRLDNNDAMLIAPDQVYFVRENLRLRLLDARTALRQHNSEVYQSDLNNAEAAVRQYFDSNSPATRSWLKELADLKSLDIRPVAEDALQSSRAAVYAYQEGIRGQAPEMPLIAAPSIITPAPAQSAAPVATPAVPALPSENRNTIIV